MIPAGNPTSSATTTTMSEPIRLVRPPYTNCAQTSVPIPLVPSGWSPPIGARASVIFEAMGSCEVSSGANSTREQDQGEPRQRDDGERIPQQPAEEAGPGRLSGRRQWGSGEIGGQATIDSAHEIRTFGLSQPRARSTSRFTMTTRTTVTIDNAEHQGNVALVGGRGRPFADAGQPEHLLDDDGATDQGDELQREHGQGSRSGVAQCMLEQHAAGRDAPAAQGPDVVLLQDVDHGSAGLRGDGCHRADRQGDGRQGDRGQPPAGAGREGGVPQGGEQAEPDGEDQRKDQAEEEVRYREGDHGDDLDHLVDPAAANGGQHAEADPEDRGQDQRADDQGHGDRERLADELADRLIVRPRGAQIALHHSAEPAPVLGEQRLVQPEFGPLGGDLLQGCLVAEDLSGGVGTGQAGQEEGQCSDHEHQHESGGKPAQDEEKHRWLPIDR